MIACARVVGLSLEGSQYHQKVIGEHHKNQMWYHLTSRHRYNGFATLPDPKIHCSMNLISRTFGESSKLFKTPKSFEIGAIATKIQPIPCGRSGFVVYVSFHNFGFPPFPKQRAVMVGETFFVFCILKDRVDSTRLVATET